MQTHELKCWPTYFDAVARGEKTFEVRKNDRFFQQGDTVVLKRLSENEFGAGYCILAKPLTLVSGPTHSAKREVGI